jgi:iron-sulfur cluster assembly protein
MDNSEASLADTAEFPLKVTEAAARFVIERHAKLGQPGAALRVGVKGGGCAGYTYVTDSTTDPPTARDAQLEFFGLKVYVDRKSLKWIGGSTIDLKKTFMHTGLQFINPHEGATCGCGATFSVKDDQE